MPYVVFLSSSLSSSLWLLTSYFQLSALALRLVPQDPSRWPNWIVATATELSSAGAANDHILEFLEIAVEEVNGADLLPAKKCDTVSEN